MLLFRQSNTLHELGHNSFQSYYGTKMVPISSTMMHLELLYPSTGKCYYWNQVNTYHELVYNSSLDNDVILLPAHSNKHIETWLNIRHSNIPAQVSANMITKLAHYKYRYTAVLFQYKHTYFQHSNISILTINKVFRTVLPQHRQVLQYLDSVNT